MPDIIAPHPDTQPGQREHFGRLKVFDERSENFLIRRSRLTFWHSLTARLRTKVNHRVWWSGNQGATSHCTAYAALHAFEAGVGHARGPGKTLHGVPRPIVPPSRVYDMAQERDPWPGSERVAPYYEGSSCTAAAKSMRDLGYIDGFDWEFDDIEVCERAIFIAPITFGLDWTVGMMLHQLATRWEDAVIRPTGKFLGGHAVVAVGYDKRRKGAEWEILNSWGPEWGFGGRCFISRDDLGNLLNFDGEAVMLRDAHDTDILAAWRRGR